jgi:hypothetical protein
MNAEVDPCEVALADDRQWFSDHPNRLYRVRPAVPGELPGVRQGWIVVRQFVPGVPVRIRMPVPIGSSPPGNCERAVRRWFDRVWRKAA